MKLPFQKITSDIENDGIEKLKKMVHFKDPRNFELNLESSILGTGIKNVRLKYELEAKVLDDRTSITFNLGATIKFDERVNLVRKYTFTDIYKISTDIDELGEITTLTMTNKAKTIEVPITDVDDVIKVMNMIIDTFNISVINMYRNLTLHNTSIDTLVIKLGFDSMNPFVIWYNGDRDETSTNFYVIKKKVRDNIFVIISIAYEEEYPRIHFIFYAVEKNGDSYSAANFRLFNDTEHDKEIYDDYGPAEGLSQVIKREVGRFINEYSDSKKLGKVLPKESTNLFIAQESIEEFKEKLESLSNEEILSIKEIDRYFIGANYMDYIIVDKYFLSFSTDKLMIDDFEKIYKVEFGDGSVGYFITYGLPVITFKAPMYIWHGVVL